VSSSKEKKISTNYQIYAIPKN